MLRALGALQGPRRTARWISGGPRRVQAQAGFGFGVAVRRADGRAAAAAAAARACSSSSLGKYLMRYGGDSWDEVEEVRQVEASADGKTFTWRQGLPADRLAAMSRGESLLSPPFALGNGRARLQFYPKGDSSCATEGMCSLWLCTDAFDRVPMRLAVGGVEKPRGASEFCRLEDAMQGGSLEISLLLDVASEALAETAAAPSVKVDQSLQLTGLEAADWVIFRAGELTSLRAGELVVSPPFRFHHVLLGDMYLELLPGYPHAEHCTIFFRCRVPTMRLRVGMAAGDAFSRSFEAKGRSTPEIDLKEGAYLQVNLDAPGVLSPDGSLRVRCALEEVVQIPPALRDMIPKLDERALWPKRL